MEYSRLKIKIRNPRPFFEAMIESSIKSRIIYGKSNSSGHVEVFTSTDRFVYRCQCEFYERAGCDIELIEMDGSVFVEMLEYDIFDYPLALVVDSRRDSIEPSITGHIK